MRLPDLEELTRRLRRSIVQVLPGGSGVVWGGSGHIVTNAHVVRSEKVGVVVASGERTVARVIWRDPKRDLALLDAGSSLSAPPAEIGDSDALHPGQLALALGNPLGLPGAVTAGVIHAVDTHGGRWIQADVRLAPGNSGGMLADVAGRVIGITTMIVNGLALAVPSNEVETFVRQQHLKRTA